MKQDKNKDYIYKSSCCKVGVNLNGIGKASHYRCNKCDKVCQFLPTEINEIRQI